MRRADVLTSAGRVAHALRDGRFSKGELATLRRLDTSEPAGAAFAKAALLWEGDTSVLEREREITLFAAFVHALARTPSTEENLGASLARAGYSEARLERLLRAQDDALIEQVKSAALFLEAKGLGAHATDTAELLFGYGKTAAAIRLRIAKDYYRSAKQEEGATS